MLEKVYSTNFERQWIVTLLQPRVTFPSKSIVISQFIG
jgi:hypothetical protein